MKIPKKSKSKLERSMQKSCTELDVPELKYWWAKKVKESLPFYELPDGSLDLEIVYGGDSDSDIVNRLSEFQDKRCESFEDLILPYFQRGLVGSDSYGSHEIIRARIQLAYFNNKKNLVKYIEDYVEPSESQIKDLIAFFNLNEIEIDILYYALCDTYTLNCCFGLSKISSDNLSEDIEIITKRPKSKIAKCLSGESTLMSEKIISIIKDRRILLNSVWEEFIFKGEIANRRRLFSFETKPSHEFLTWWRRKRIANIDDTEIPPFDYFLKITSVKLVHAYPERNDCQITFSYLPFNKTRYLSSPIKEIVGKHGFYFMNRKIDYKTARNDPEKIIGGEMSVFFLEEDFEIIVNELKNNYPEYYEQEVATHIKDLKLPIGGQNGMHI